MKTQLLIAGDGPTLQDDLAAFSAVHDLAEWDVMAINRAIHKVPKAEHLAALYPHMIWRWIKDLNYTPMTHAPAHDRGVSTVWRNTGYEHGTSSMFGMLVATGLGYKRIVLAGVPLLSASGERLYGDKCYEAWDALPKRLYPDVIVHSMSGYTKDVFGGLR